MGAVKFNAMPVIVNDRAIEGAGTTEAQWLSWPGLVCDTPCVSAAALVPEQHRAVIVAPHPDDEILMLGGLMQQLARLRRRLLLIAVTDGSASHAGSTEWTPQRLALERPQESADALRRLRLHSPPQILRLGLPDGAVVDACASLTDRLTDLLHGDDVVFSTWRHDGHPDHDATGRACARATARRGAALVEVPVWAWHWARPGDTRLPWQRARRVLLEGEASQRKREAVRAFTSQLLPDASTGAGPILRSTTVERTARPFELVFV